MAKAKNHIQFDSLSKLSDYLNTMSIVGSKLLSINNYDPYAISSFPERSNVYMGDWYAPIDKIVNWDDVYFCNINGYGGNNFQLHFDNGDYLNIDCWADDELLIWVTKDVNDNRISKHNPHFNLTRFFDTTIGKKLLKIELKRSDDAIFSPDNGGDAYDNDILFYGKLKLVFDGGHSLLFGCRFCSPHIASYRGNLMDTCNYWHVLSCDEYRVDMLKDECIASIKSDLEYANNCLILDDDKSLDSVDDEMLTSVQYMYNDKFVNDLITKISSLSINKIYKIWRFIRSNTFYSPKSDFPSQDTIMHFVDDCINNNDQTTMMEDMMQEYATYITKIVKHKDIINEDYLLLNIDSITKMQILLDKITQMGKQIKADQVQNIIRDINNKIKD